jgi:hypothetical protein
LQSNPRPCDTYRYKTDYLQELPILQRTRVLDIQEDDSNNLGIYIENNEEEINELTIYFDEKKVIQKVFLLILKNY